MNVVGTYRDRRFWVGVVVILALGHLTTEWRIGSMIAEAEALEVESSDRLERSREIRARADARRVRYEAQGDTLRRTLEALDAARREARESAAAAARVSEALAERVRALASPEALPVVDSLVASHALEVAGYRREVVALELRNEALTVRLSRADSVIVAQGIALTASDSLAASLTRQSAAWERAAREAHTPPILGRIGGAAKWVGLGIVGGWALSRR